MSRNFTQEALRELDEEIFREKVEKEKARLKKVISGYRWWHRFIPFKLVIKIERR